MTDDPVFRRFEGLTDFVDPAFFDDAVQDVIHHIESYFPCVIEVIGSTRAAHVHFLKALDAVPLREHTMWLWLNLLVEAVKRKVVVSVESGVTKGHHQFQHIEILSKHSSQAVGVGLGVAAMRAEMQIPMAKCQISLDRLGSLTMHLGANDDEWMFDQTQILGFCGSYAQS